MKIDVKKVNIYDLVLTEEEVLMIRDALVQWGKVCPTSEQYQFRYKSMLNTFKNVIGYDSND